MRVKHRDIVHCVTGRRIKADNGKVKGVILCVVEAARIAKSERIGKEADYSRDGAQECARRTVVRDGNVDELKGSRWVPGQSKVVPYAEALVGRRDLKSKRAGAEYRAIRRRLVEIAEGVEVVQQATFSRCIKYCRTFCRRYAVYGASLAGSFATSTRIEILRGCLLLMRLGNLCGNSWQGSGLDTIQRLPLIGGRDGSG